MASPRAFSPQCPRACRPRPSCWQSTNAHTRTLTPSGADTFMELMAAAGERASAVAANCVGPPAGLGGGAPLSPAVERCGECVGRCVCV